MTESRSSGSSLRGLIHAWFPAHADAAGEPVLETDAHPAVRRLWTAIGESTELAPYGLARDAIADRVAGVFRRWLKPAPMRAAWGIRGRVDGIPTDKLPVKPRWLTADDYTVHFIDDSNSDAEPPVLRVVRSRAGFVAIDRGYTEFMVDRFCGRMSATRRASYYYGTPVDDHRTPTLGLLHPRLHDLAPGVWSWELPPERVLERDGANILYTQLGHWIEFVAGLAPEHRSSCMPPQQPLLVLERNENSPQLLAAIDPCHRTPASNPAQVELTPPFQRVSQSQQAGECWNRVGRLGGLAVWLFARPDHDDIYVFYEAAEHDAVRRELEALGGVIAG